MTCHLAAADGSAQMLIGGSMLSSVDGPSPVSLAHGPAYRSVRLQASEASRSDLILQVLQYLRAWMHFRSISTIPLPVFSSMTTRPPRKLRSVIPITVRSEAETCSAVRTSGDWI